ncbi:AraC family two component transcriptional regulator [Calothrix parasitica NIES-267]|uniref:AraC family two component transcriptional regulator n=1 Tax=Calothrix parasitica NIES-267 TaxID=1973488 RepID=A0A1Z4LSB3_9CYAN|nr:AraC family two component transcriptional regulator [Calothrix parasitica NIES-267]
MINAVSKKILVIEDDARTRNMYLDGLENEGFEMISAPNGNTGIQQAVSSLPDLVICDILMPDIDGFTVLNRLRQNPNTAIIPFIFLTGRGSQEDFRKGMESGADDYIAKPATVEQLLRAIAIRLEKKQVLLRHCCADNTDKTQSESNGDNSSKEEKSIFPIVPQLKEVFDFIEANYQKGITLSDVAEAVGYSAAYLTNRVAKITGETVNSWIVKRRMSAARYLLKNTSLNIEQIATNVGYQNACHFSRQFRQHHKIPPQAWRKKHQFIERYPVEA